MPSNRLEVIERLYDSAMGRSSELRDWIPSDPEGDLETQAAELPHVAVPLGERLLTRDQIMSYDDPEDWVKLIARDLIWVSAFALGVPNHLSGDPAKDLAVSSAMAARIEKSYDSELLNQFRKWCYWARTIHYLGSDDSINPAPFVGASIATSTMAGLVIDLGMTEGLDLGA